MSIICDNCKDFIKIFIEVKKTHKMRYEGMGRTLRLLHSESKKYCRNFFEKLYYPIEKEEEQ